MRRGFTLVELLVVIAICGILAALIIPAVSAAIKAAKEQERSQIETTYVEPDANTDDGEVDPGDEPEYIVHGGESEGTFPWAGLMLAVVASMCIIGGVGWLLFPTEIKGLFESIRDGL